MPTLIDLLAPTKIRTRNHGVFFLRDISLGDTSFLLLLLETPSSDGQFAAAVIHHMLVEPKLSRAAIETLPPAVLSHIGRVWLRSAEDVLVDNRLPPLLAFRQAVEVEMEPWQARNDEKMRAFHDSISTSTQTMIQATMAQLRSSMAVNFQQIISQTHIRMMQMAPQIQDMQRVVSGIAAAQMRLNAAEMLQSFVSSVSAEMRFMPLAGPGLEQFIVNVARQTLGTQRMLDAIQMMAAQLLNNLAPAFVVLRPLLEDIDVVTNSEYGFVVHLLPIQTISWLASVDPRVRHALATRTFLPYSQSTEFEDQLDLLFQQHPLLARRWRIVQNGLHSHQCGDYISSIRVLMPEIDGIYGDMLLIRGRVREERKKLYALDTHGRWERIKNDKRRELHSLDYMIKHHGFTGEPVMERVVQHLKMSFPQDRNPNLHGRIFRYDRPMLSIQLLLLLFVLAEEFLPEGAPVIGNSAHAAVAKLPGRKPQL